MRDPDNIAKSYELEAPPAVIEMKDIPEYNFQDYDLADEKQFKKYIQNVERDVRGSFEYKSMINYLREYMDMNQCAFYKNINNIDNPKVHIEIHHEPLSLYDICIIVYNKRVAFHESIEEEWVAKEVMYLHYNLMVGLIPLAETVHELVHSGKIFIPLQFIDIGFNDFYNEYMDTIKGMDGLTDMLNAKVALSKEFAKDPDQFTSILKKKYTYVANQGYDAIPEKIEK